MRCRAAVVTIWAVASLSGCAEESSVAGRLSADTFEGPWPLTVDAIDVDCTNGLNVIAVAPDGRGYALRGGEGPRAREVWGASVYSFLDLVELDPRLQEVSPGARRDSSRVLTAALEMCEDAGLAGWTNRESNGR